MRDFQVIQRGTFCSTFTKDSALTGCKGVVMLDQMQEPEFGGAAIPKSFRRIMGAYMSYDVIRTGIKSSSGKELMIFCQKDKAKNIIRGLKEFLWYGWETKEEPQLAKALADRPWTMVSTNFWWCIDFPRESCATDWMAFFEDKEDAFRQAIANDFNAWWMGNFKESERVREYQRSFC